MVNVLNGLSDNDTIILVGHSFGAGSLLNVAARTSREIDLLALLDPAMSGDFFDATRGKRPADHSDMPGNVRHFYNR